MSLLWDAHAQLLDYQSHSRSRYDEDDYCEECGLLYTECVCEDEDPEDEDDAA